MILIQISNKLPNVDVLVYWHPNVKQGVKQSVSIALVFTFKSFAIDFIPNFFKKNPINSGLLWIL